MNTMQNPALDALVAEKVLELAPCEEWEETGPGTGSGPIMSKKCRSSHHCYPKGYPLAFSSLIAPAWHVLNHLADKGWEVSVRRRPGQDPPFEVRIDKLTEADDDVYVATSVTAPLAICQAALRACGYNAPLP